MSKNPFPASAPAANPIFYRTYSRMTDEGRETFEQVTERTVNDISKLGRFTDEQTALVRKMQEECKVLPSGRWLWTGGTEWIQDPKNFSGSYNCTSTRGGGLALTRVDDGPRDDGLWHRGSTR